MKKLLAALLAVAMLSGAYSVTAFSFSDDAQIVAQRGCCSRHGGVAGCDENGRVICRDGSKSPSCRC